MGIQNVDVKVGSTYYEETVCDGTQYASDYSIRLHVTIHRIEEEEKQAYVSMYGSLMSRNKRSWSNDACTFKLAVDGVSKETVNRSSGGSSTQQTYTASVMNWTGYIPYNDDGTLTARLEASVSGGDTANSPGKGSAVIIATFPPFGGIARIGVDGTIKQAIAHLGVSNLPKKCDLYIGVNGTPKNCG